MQHVLHTLPGTYFALWDLAQLWLKRCRCSVAPQASPVIIYATSKPYIAAYLMATPQVISLNLVALVVVVTPACGHSGALFAEELTVVCTVKGIFIVSAQHCVSSCCRVVYATEMCAESTFEVWDDGGNLDGD